MRNKNERRKESALGVLFVVLVSTFGPLLLAYIILLIANGNGASY